MLHTPTDTNHVSAHRTRTNRRDEQPLTARTVTELDEAMADVVEDKR